jgi:hypothetical protein
MSCERYHEAIADTAAGLPPAAGLELHLASCAACSSELARLREALGVADAALDELARAEPAPELRVRIRQVVMTRQTTPWLVRPLAVRLPLYAAAALALALLVAWSVRRADHAPAMATTATAPMAPLPSAVAQGQPTRDGQATPRPSAAHSTASVVREEPRRLASSAPAQRRPTEARRASPRSAAAPGRPQPEVLVPRGQEQTLLQLVALLQREPVEMPVLAGAGEPSPDLPEPPPIQIKPLEIVPLDPAEASGT